MPRIGDGATISQPSCGSRGLQRPVLVGWSFGGNVICDYVRSSGTEALAGINFVAAGTKSDPAFFGPGRNNYPGMYSDDLATNIASTRGVFARMLRTPTGRGRFRDHACVQHGGADKCAHRRAWPCAQSW